MHIHIWKYSGLNRQTCWHLKRKKGDDIQVENSMELCHSCHLGFSAYWRQAIKHRLRISERQRDDPTLAAFIEIMAQRKPTQAEIDATFYNPADINCGIEANQVLDFLTPDMRILCTLVEDCHAYNKLAAHRFFGRNPPCTCR